MGKKITQEDLRRIAQKQYVNELKERVGMLKLQYDELFYTINIKKLEEEHKQMFPEYYKQPEGEGRKEKEVGVTENEDTCKQKES